MLCVIRNSEKCYLFSYIFFCNFFDTFILCGGYLKLRYTCIPRAGVRSPPKNSSAEVAPSASTRRRAPPRPAMGRALQQPWRAASTPYRRHGNCLTKSAVVTQQAPPYGGPTIARRRRGQASLSPGSFLLALPLERASSLRAAHQALAGFAARWVHPWSCVTRLHNSAPCPCARSRQHAGTHAGTQPATPPTRRPDAAPAAHGAGARGARRVLERVRHPRPCGAHYAAARAVPLSRRNRQVPPPQRTLTVVRRCGRPPLPLKPESASAPPA